MIGISDREYAAIRFESFAGEVLAPAVHPRRAPLEVAVFQTAGRPGLDEASRAAFTPVSPGFRWGPAWSTAWFRIRGEVPREMAGRPVALRFSSGTEALLWQGGEPRQGFDDNRDTCLLFPEAEGGEAIECFVEAACNMPLGISTFWWDHPELHQRWQGPEPGRLERCELVAVDPALWSFRQRYELARRLALALPEASARSHELLRGLRAITDAIPARDPAEAARAAGAELDALLAGGEHRPATTCVAVGHAHIDTAWLWPLAETRRKVLRSWASALELMERFPGFRFLASQAQQYAMVEEASPALFERIRSRVSEGRWEAGGAMWVECDCHAPSGESLIRQILHGVGYWRERFGESAQQRYLWLPDTFGFPASLPQIMRLSGLDTFITDKMAWSERNELPHVSFRWRGIDGSEVLAHLTPGENYNAPLQPEDLLRGQDRVVRKDQRPVGPDRVFIGRWLQPFGHGDGGGGPTAEIVHRAQLAARVEGLPRVEPGRVDSFCEALHRERREQKVGGRDLPAWDGELYLEQHRGTLTSQAWIKRANALAERRLRLVEALLACRPDGEAARELAPKLDAVWKIVLLHQFHDILPGTSIAEVYADAREAFGRVEEDLDGALAMATRSLVAGADASGMAAPVLVLNPCSHERAAVVRLGEGLVQVRDLAPLGAALLDVATTEPDAPQPAERVRVGDRTLENAHLSATLDEAGRIAELRSAGCELPVNAVRRGGTLAPLNQLVAYEDRPRRWEAWNVDWDCADKPFPLDGRADSIEVVESGALRGAIEVRRRFHESTIVQRYVLEAGARRIEVETEIDWRESRTLLRTLNPTGVRARFATCGIQLGHVQRPTHRNTSWEEARFEVPGHRWMDLSQPGLGLALLDDGKYGRSIHENALGLSLLRAPTFPDPDADRGCHQFCYGFLPHAGDWRAARVPREADELAEPPVVVSLESGPGPASPGAGAPWDRRPGAGGSRLAPFELELEGGADLEIACFKPAQDGRGLVLRLVERRGGLGRGRIRWRMPVAGVRAADLLEEPVEREIQHRADPPTTELALRPFEILTLLVEPRRSGP